MPATETFIRLMLRRTLVHSVHHSSSRREEKSTAMYSSFRRRRNLPHSTRHPAAVNVALSICAYEFMLKISNAIIKNFFILIK